jgi:hypothetical protein
MFTLGKAFGGAKDTSDPSAVPTDPFGRVRHEFRTLGSTLDRFDASVKSALRKIPGSRMPLPRAEARAAEAARAPKPGLFDRLRSGAKGKARATSEPEKDSRRAQKKEKQKTKKATEKKTPKTVPASAPATPKAVSPEPAEAPRRTKRPTEAVSQPPKRLSANTKKRADDSEVRDYISRSYKPRDADEKNKEEHAPAKKESASVTMPPKPPQKVTFADLDDADKSLVARARAAMAAMAHVEPTRANLAAGAAAILAAHVLAKAWRARAGTRRDEEKVDDDIDSAFGTPTRAGAVDRPTASAKGKAPASMPAAGTASAKRLVFGDETKRKTAGTAAALRPADVNRAAGTLPSRASSSKQNRFGVGADALAAAVRAKTTVIKATRRLKRSGELRVDVLEATFLDAPEDSGDAFTFRVAVDADAHSVRGATPARAFDNKHRRDVVTFNSRLAFSLPASSDGHAGKRVEARLCDGAGRTVAKTAVLLRAALRAAPVTKSFPLHDRAGLVVGTARLAIEWDYAKQEQDAKENDTDAVSAAAKVLAAVKE